MISKEKWFKRFYIRLRLSKSLYVYKKNKETQFTLFFVGWYERGLGEKLYSINILFFGVDYSILKSEKKISLECIGEGKRNGINKKDAIDCTGEHNCVRCPWVFD